MKLNESIPSAELVRVEPYKDDFILKVNHVRVRITRDEAVGIAEDILDAISYDTPEGESEEEPQAEPDVSEVHERVPRKPGRPRKK